MRRRGFSFRKARTRVYRPRIQHSPASIGNTISTNDQLVTFQAVSTVRAGSAATTTRTSSDRSTEITSGSKIGQITVDVGIRTITNEGILEYIVFKVERSHVTPVKGVDPIPADTDVNTAGLQQSYRMNMPGWIIKYGKVAFSAETPKAFKITANYGKFGKAVIRDGDFCGITFFNRSSSAIIFDWEARYFEYR